MRINIMTFAILLLALGTAPVGAAAAPSPGPTATSVAQEVERAPVEGGPEVFVQTPDIQWGNETIDTVGYSWSTRVENPNDRAVLVKVELNFVDSQGQVLQTDWVTGHVGPNSAVVLQQDGGIPAPALDRVAEARGVPSAWWADEPYKIRTLAAFVDGLQRLEVFFVLEDWAGRPVIANGTADLYIVEKSRLQADFAGGGMRRQMKTLYARRFEIDRSDFARRRIGFISDDYSPPALSLGPIPYSVFDETPITDQGLIRVVFRTAGGSEIVAEDNVFF